LGDFFINSSGHPGYNASVVKIYSASNSMARGVVDANSKVVGLAPGWTIFAISGDDCFPLAIFS
jgi:hypothetical protein